MKHVVRLLPLLCGLMPVAPACAAADYVLEIRDHLFLPDLLRVPAMTKVRLRVINHDSTPEEFESYALNREKVIMGGQQVVIFIGPLAPGIYDFFGEFNPRTAQGRIVAE